MGPLPYPHRVTFLATTLSGVADPDVAPFVARALAVIVFDHFVRHRIVTLGEDDERVTDEHGQMLDIRHPQIDDSIDWLFRIGRRHEVLYFEVGLDRSAAPVLHARRPDGSAAEWGSSPEVALSQQLSQCLAQWLGERRLPSVGPLADFTLDDLRVVATQLARVDTALLQYGELAKIPKNLLVAPRLAVPYYRILAELARDEARTFDARILELDPQNPVACRNRYVTGLLHGEADRRDILPVIADAPMYGKPHLSIWGEPFAAERPLEGMGVRHQGIAASLMPANPYACHNYSLQLADVARREESYRWADRATVAAPQFGAAHLDCVRRLRQLGRPGQAFAEAQFRCREILDREATGKLPANDWQAPHHAALLIAFTHLDIGRLDEAIELADAALARVPTDAPTQEAFNWAKKRIAHWKSDAGLLARAYAWEGHHRGDPGRVITGMTRGRLTDDEDAMMLIDSLVTLGRDDQAEVAYWHCAGIDGQGILGDGKARLVSAKTLILNGDLAEAFDQIQIVQLRRGHSRLEAEINRILRLAAIRSASEWDNVIERKLEVGAIRLARTAARDLADFVPAFDTAIARRALGERTPFQLDPLWIAELIGAVPAAQQASATILSRLGWPREDSLRAADTLAQEWWTVLVPPARDRDAHAAGAVLALGVALANYFVATAGPATPIAGAYRHIATEALHLVRRSRYQIEPAAIQALLRLVDHLGGKVPEWLLDTWLLRIERALDLEAEHGAYLETLIAGMPTVQRMLRGDERTGWELRLAHDLATDPSQYEPAAMLYERCARAIEGGTVELAWSTAAVAGASGAVALDVHWLAAMANPSGVGAPWLRAAEGLFAAGRAGDGFAAACRGMAATPSRDRAIAVNELTPSWKAAANATPLNDAAAFDAGLAAASEDNLPLAVQHLRWAAACEPGNAKRAQGLAVALARLGQGLEAVRVLACHERTDAPRLIGRVLLDAGRHADATMVLRYAARRFRSPDDWETLACAASRADNDAVCIEAGRKALALGARTPLLLEAMATSLYRLGEFVECEEIARQLIASGSNEIRCVGLHAMARALAGQGRHVDAHPYAKAAAELGPNGELAADLIETMDRIIAQQTPAIRQSPEHSMERRAYADLEAGAFDTLISAITSPAWGIARVALTACEFRKDDESGLAIAPRALDAAVAILGRTEGALHPEAVLARIRALRIRDNAFIQIDPPPPLGRRLTPAEFDRAYAERDRRPHRPSAIMSAAR